jgi:hypothetical protein
LRTSNPTCEINRANNSFENAAELKYFLMTVTYQNVLYKEIKNKFFSGNACYHAVQNLYFSLNIIRMLKSKRMRWVGHVAHIAEMTNAYKTVIGNPEGKRTLGRPRRRWEDNIKMA